MDIKTAIFHYCNYQERCHQEVKNKLYELKATTPEVNQLMADVIEEGLLNEERFARAYARGKFRIKQWGRNKIKSALKGKNVSEYCIKKGLEEIDLEEYEKVLNSEAEKTWNYYKNEKPAWKRLAKARQLLLAHGFEGTLIEEALRPFTK